MIFTLAGMLVFVAYPRILETGINEEVLFRLAEIGLVLLLFTDASRSSKRSRSSIWYWYFTRFLA
jgi:hypothetical protein